MRFYFEMQIGVVRCHHVIHVMPAQVEKALETLTSYLSPTLLGVPAHQSGPYSVGAAGGLLAHLDASFPNAVIRFTSNQTLFGLSFACRLKPSFLPS